ncbi:MAG: protein kinase [Archangium sp.]
MADTDTSRDSSDGAKRSKPRLRVAETFPMAIGAFRAVRELGRGGQGVVYEAEDPELQRTVALKLLHGGAAENVVLLTEARASALVAHPNVVTIYEAKTWRDQVYVAMEYLPGGSVTRWVTARPRTNAEVVERFTQAARGLAAIHERQLVHRDFKPDNILLRENGTAAVADFGLARPASDSDVSTSGTRRYMAPEIFAGKPPSAHSDQYAFCVSLFWALTRQHVTERGGEVQYPPEMPTWLRRIISKGLQRDPAHRYESMEALISDLEYTPEVRRRAMWRNLLLVTGFTALATAGVIYRSSETPAERALRECTERITTQAGALWSPARADRVQKNFTALAGTQGTQTFERVRQRIEPQVAAWQQASVKACSITEPAAQRSTQACLEVRRVTLGSITDYLATTTEPTLVRDVLHTLARELKPVEACQRATVLAADAEETDEERALRVQLAPAFVLRAEGKTDEARLKASTVATAADGAPRVKAEAMMLAAQLRAEALKGESDEFLTTAIYAAEAVGNDELRAMGYISLISFHANREEIPAAEAAEKHASALVARLGSPPLLRAPLLNAQGTFEFAKNKLGDAHAKYQELKTLLLQSRDASDPSVLRAENNLLLSGDVSLQVPGFEKLVKQSADELGDAHPETLLSRHNLASALLNNGECGRAETILTALIDTRLTGAPHLKRSLASDFALRARVWECLGQPEKAIADQEENLTRMVGSDKQRSEELKWQFLEKRKAGRKKEQLDAVRKEICELGFGSPDATPCPR